MSFRRQVATATRALAQRGLNPIEIRLTPADMDAFRDNLSIFHLQTFQEGGNVQFMGLPVVFASAGKPSHVAGVSGLRAEIEPLLQDLP
jgi:hypothetical protein